MKTLNTQRSTSNVQFRDRRLSCLLAKAFGVERWALDVGRWFLSL